MIRRKRRVLRSCIGISVSFWGYAYDRHQTGIFMQLIYQLGDATILATMLDVIDVMSSKMSGNTEWILKGLPPTTD